MNETSELLSIENRLVATANIDNQDARHIITAVSCGAYYFLTADKDFAKFNTQDIKIAYPTQMSLPNCTSVPTITIPRYDKIDFEELEKIIDYKNVNYPQVKILVAGGINLSNIEKYVSYKIDGVVTSSDYNCGMANISSKLEII